MGKIYALFLAVLFACTSLAKTPISDEQRLFATAKVWGFLKYYHPQVAKGKFDWDQELFDFLDKTKNVTTNDELSNHFITWIASLGMVKPRHSSEKPDKTIYFDRNLDLGWRNNTVLFSPELAAQLQYIEQNRHRGKSYYASTHSPTGNFNPLHEKEYKDANWKDVRIRLLSLFRYWNQVEYFFPYKYMTDQKWDDVLWEMIPAFRDASTELEYHQSMLRLVVKVDDTHAMFFSNVTNANFGYYWAPVEYKFVENKAIITRFFDADLAKANDLRIGDIIESVNGVPTAEIIARQMPYISGSNRSSKLRQAYYCLLNGPTDSAEVTLERNGETIRKTITRYYVKDFKSFDAPPIQKAWDILDGNIGYVNMGALEFDIKAVDQMMKRLKSTKSIIFDIRNYPNGTMYLIAMHLHAKEMPFAKLIAPDLDYPGRYKWTHDLKCGPARQRSPYAGKVLLLVNEETQSHAEFTTMGLQVGPNVTTIGSQTSGADGNVSSLIFPGGFATGISGLGVFYPDGTETQRRGVKIDLEVKPTIRGIREGRDEVMEKALELANSF